MPWSSLVRVATLLFAIGALLPAVAPAPVLARAPCPDRHAVTVHQLLDLAPYDVSGYWGVNPRAHACFGGQTITIRGFANWPDGLGGTSTSGIRPAYFEWPTFFLFASSRELAPGFGKGSFYGIVVPPRLGSVERTYHREWVVVTASFESPLANRCRGFGPEADRPTRAEAIATCRDQLVLTSVRVAAGLPDTDATIQAVRTGRSGLQWLLLAAAVLGVCAAWRRHSVPIVGERR